MDHCKECHAVKELVDYRDKLQSEVERLQAEVVGLTMDNCKLIKMSLYDGLGRPELIDDKCGGYAGNMDEPHWRCQECKAFCMDEEG